MHWQFKLSQCLPPFPVSVLSISPVCTCLSACLCVHLCIYIPILSLSEQITTLSFQLYIFGNICKMLALSKPRSKLESSPSPPVWTIKPDHVMKCERIKTTSIEKWVYNSTEGSKKLSGTKPTFKMGYSRGINVFWISLTQERVITRLLIVLSWECSFETTVTHSKSSQYNDVIKRKHFTRYWPFMRGIHCLLRNSPHKGQWRGVLMFYLICA